MMPIVLCISQQNSVILSIKYNEENGKKRVPENQKKRGARIKRRITKDMSVFSKHEQLNKDYSFCGTTGRHPRRQSSKLLIDALSIVPFHKRLKEQTHMQVT